MFTDEQHNWPLEYLAFYVNAHNIPDNLSIFVYIICTYCIHYRLKRLPSPHLTSYRGNWNIYSSITKYIHNFGTRHFQSGPEMLRNYTAAYSNILLSCTNCMDNLLKEYSKSRFFSPSHFWRFHVKTVTYTLTHCCFTNYSI